MWSGRLKFFSFETFLGEAGGIICVRQCSDLSPSHTSLPDALAISTHPIKASGVYPSTFGVPCDRSVFCHNVGGSGRGMFTRGKKVAAAVHRSFSVEHREPHLRNGLLFAGRGSQERRCQKLTSVWPRCHSFAVLSWGRGGVKAAASGMAPIYSSQRIGLISWHLKSPSFTCGYEENVALPSGFWPNIPFSTCHSSGGQTLPSP